MASVERIYDAALDAGIDRKAVLVALGGGVVGDLTAFAASTILRGVRFVMIPTTLLAQVDSSVGGKTGMDRRQGKNLVGTFWQPSAVVIDPATLRRLPPRELRAGLAEVVKTGVILDAELFARLERDADALLARDRDRAHRGDRALRTHQSRCRRAGRARGEGPAPHPQLRPHRRARARAGHRLRPLPSRRGRRDRHGRGRAAVRAARHLPGADARRIEALLGRFGLAHEVPPGLDRDALARAIALDKKAERTSVAYIVCEAIGRCRAETLEVAEIAASI